MLNDSSGYDRKILRLSALGAGSLLHGGGFCHAQPTHGQTDPLPCVDSPPITAIIRVPHPRAATAGINRLSEES